MRVAVDPGGSIGLDTGPDRAGRGAYVCRDPRCIEKAVAQGGFQRRLKGGSVTESLTERLLEEAGKRKSDG
ncbi:MAG: YlxR family protein [Actinomycetota bacterium]|nr:YlxR family protein [Actinomycetota bacterium]